MGRKVIIVGTETITTEFLSHNGTKYEVTVTYGPEAKIPEGSTLSVTDIEEGTDAYEYARNAVLADKQAKGEKVFLPGVGLAALDISIMNPAGEEIEPEAPVQVDIKIKSLPNVENLNDVADSIEIQHHVETGDKVVIDTVYDGGSTDAKFDVVTNEQAIAKGTAIDPNSYIIDEATNDADEIDASFEVEAFSTYTIYYYYDYYSKRVHYVDTNGNSLTPTMTPNFDARYQFLIYDIEGYEYDSTHVGSRTGTSIAPILRASNDYYGLYYSRNIQYRNGNNWSNLNNDDIYVVYKKKTAPTTGGTPEVDEDETWPEGNDAPQFSKSSVNNGNGTNTISLSIKAAEKAVDNKTKANVIVVLDASASMSTNMDGQSRWNRAKKAVSDMADILLNKKDTSGNKLVKMALITFGGKANPVQGFTDDPSTLKGYIPYSQYADNTYLGATNWEQALYNANRVANEDSDAATFIVFVTDGDPTFRISRGEHSDAYLDVDTSNTYEPYRNGIFGMGNATSDDDFDYAVEQVKEIVANNKNFYAIGVSNDVTKVQKLCTDAGVSAQNAFLATNSQKLQEAFDSIVSSISATLGFGDVEITDGITAMSNGQVKGANVDTGSFKYYRYGGKKETTSGGQTVTTNDKYGTDYAHKTEWTTREADGCAAANYNESTGAVEWNMGESFQLEDGVTYIVEFVVWPKQSAYDLVAELNNGTKQYSTLDSADKAQVVPVVDANGDPVHDQYGNPQFALKTNTDTVNATYKRTTKSGDTVSTEDVEASKADYTQGTIENMSLATEKITLRKDWIGGDDPGGEYDFIVTSDEKEFYKATMSSPDWESSAYISAGLMTTNPLRIYEEGHDYTLTEPENLSYHWDYESVIYRPMVIDKVPTILVKVDSPGTGTYEIDGNYYRPATSSETALVATNTRRSNLNISKTVVDTQGNTISNDDSSFTMKVKVIEAHDEKVWLSAFDTVTKQTIKDKTIVTGTGVEYQESDGFFSAPSGTDLTLTIKNGWNYRFTNLSKGTSYTITEVNIPDGYSFDSIEATVSGTGGTAPSKTGQTASGTIDASNCSYTAAYKNLVDTASVTIRKVDSKTNQQLSGSKFTITKGDPEVTVQGEFEPIQTYAIPIHGVYCLTETSAPDGYIILDKKIYFKFEKSGTSDVVVLTDKSGNKITDGSLNNKVEVDGTTITVKNIAGHALPNTGGPGTLPYTLSGIALIMASALMYGFRMRRRERRYK